MRTVSALVVVALAELAASRWTFADARPIVITIAGGRVAAAAQAGDHSSSASPADSSTTPYTVPRYDNGRLEQRVEADDRTCQFISAGTVTIPVQAQYGVATTGTPPCTVPPDYPYCPGVTYPACSVVYYTRIQHNNKSIRPDKAGAVDTFTYHWTTPDKYWDLTIPVYVASPVVRPKGETNAFESWNEGKGHWRVTLVPPDNDPTFDFTGEQVRETYVTESDGCVGAGSSKSNAETVKNGPPGNFGDSVGYSACAIEYARAKKRTPCGYRITQKMEISAPSDGGVFTQYGGGLNTLIAIVTGRLIDQVEGQHSIGTVSSQRVTPLSAPQPVPKGMATQRLDCLRGGLLGLQLMSEF